MTLIAHTISFPLTGVLIAPFMAAIEPVNCYEESCANIARELHDLYQENLNSPCICKLGIAAAQLEAATMSLRYEKVAQALRSLDVAVRELRELSCIWAYYSSVRLDVEHILHNVIRTRGDLTTILGAHNLMGDHEC